MLWKNNDRTEKELIYVAVERFRNRGDIRYPTRVFILDDFYATDFRKETPGGMMGSKQYFDLKKLNIANTQDLAEKLKGKTWDNYQTL